MKTLLSGLLLAFAAISGFSGQGYASAINAPADTLKLQADSSHNVYYQKTVRVNSNIMAPQIFDRAVQFAAGKNFVQNYADDQEWKLIFTSSQDLNINQVYVGDDNDAVDPYSVQFAITLDLKNGRYRYTINNVVFFIPNNNYNKRETLFDIYLKANNTDSKRVARNAKALIASFERYLSALTDELHQQIEQKATMYSPKF